MALAECQTDRRQRGRKAVNIPGTLGDRCNRVWGVWISELGIRGVRVRADQRVLRASGFNRTGQRAVVKLSFRIDRVDLSGYYQLIHFSRLSRYSVLMGLRLVVMDARHIHRLDSQIVDAGE